jgi:hypothetical protein
LSDHAPTNGEALCAGHGETWTLAVPAQDEVLRFVPEKRIERSTDGGASWTTAVALTGQDARMAYYAATRNGTTSGAGPYDALVDPATGHVIVAMGHEGTLVRTAPGEWEWIAVGPYRYEPLRTPGQILTLLQGELGLAISAGFVTVALAGWRGLTAGAQTRPDPDASGENPGARKHRGWLVWTLRILSVVSALGVVVAALIVRPATISGYATIISFATVIAALAITLVLAAVMTVVMARESGPGKRRWLLGRLGWLVLPPALCLLPYVAWATGRLSTYTPAAWIAVTIATVIWIAAAVTGEAQSKTG